MALPQFAHANKICDDSKWVTIIAASAISTSLQNACKEVGMNFTKEEVASFGLLLIKSRLQNKNSSQIKADKSSCKEWCKSLSKTQCKDVFLKFYMNDADQRTQSMPKDELHKLCMAAARTL